MSKTLAEVTAEIQSRVEGYGQLYESAVASFNSEADYYEGLLDAYTCALGMLQELDKADKEVN